MSHNSSPSLASNMGGLLLLGVAVVVFASLLFVVVSPVVLFDAVVVVVFGTIVEVDVVVVASEADFV